MSSVICTLIDNGKSANQIARLRAIVVKNRLDSRGTAPLTSRNRPSGRKDTRNREKKGEMETARKEEWEIYGIRGIARSQRQVPLSAI